MTLNFDVSGEPYTSFQEYNLYRPEIDDFSLSTAKMSEDFQSYGTQGVGKHQVVFNVPFSGLGTFAVCDRDYCQDGYDTPNAFTFVAMVEHATVASVSGVPKRAKRKGMFTVSARVQSPAGQPVGSCLFEPASGKGLRAVGPVPLAAGTCSARLTAGTGKQASYRARFEGAEGWLDNSVLTRKVAVAPKRTK